MIVLFRPVPPFMEVCTVGDNGFSAERILFDRGWPEKIFDSLDAADNIEGIGFLLRHGGELFTETASLINKETMNKLSTSIKFAPEYNEITLKAVQIFFEKFSDIPQVLLCDTAYFVDLPDEASTYAVPYELHKQGIKRYGGYGLIHNWIWERTREYSGNGIKKLINVCLGDTPNIVAIKRGLPIETSIGFTSVEGLPSFQGCGDIDPTIVFRLYANGESFQEIHDLLSNRSGFSGLSGQECHYSDVVKNRNNAEISRVKEILKYDIIKYLGAFTSLLGGVDALAFFTNSLKGSEEFIREICCKIKFFGLAIEKDQKIKKQPIQEFTRKDSRVKVLCIEKSQWDVMAQEVKKIIKKEL